MINAILKKGGEAVKLDDEVTLAQQDTLARERLIEQNMDFIRRCASRAAGRFVDSHDNACSEAMIAFNDAISAYRPVSSVRRGGHPQPGDRPSAARKPQRRLRAVQRDACAGCRDTV